MTLSRMRMVVMAGLSVLATAAQAQNIVTLTPTSNQSSVLSSLRAGDTLRISGTFSAPLTIRNRDFGNVQVNAQGAVFQGGVALVNVHNLAFTGGTYGRTDANLAAWHTMRVEGSSNISMNNGIFLGNGDPRGTGLQVIQSNQVTVRDSQFSGNATGLGVRTSTNVLVTRNRINGSTADGINIVDSNRVLVSSNSCSGFMPSASAHPDCVQLWSTGTRPVQSEIAIINNSAVGNMQGFASFDPRNGSGNRLVFAGNYAAISYAHSVSCYGCNDSIFVDNVLVNQPGSSFGLPLVRLLGGSGNLVANNLAFDVRSLSQQPGFVMPGPAWSSYMPAYASLVGSQIGRGGFGAAGFLDPYVSGVPEPANWVMMVLGFGLVGRMLRRQSGPRLVLA
ncbi:MAG: PEPxxWA-CTERM sorting domain-containing protein [Sphingomonadales bacterium]|jgi:hypothetical protein